MSIRKRKQPVQQDDTEQLQDKAEEIILGLQQKLSIVENIQEVFKSMPNIMIEQELKKARLGIIQDIHLLQQIGVDFIQVISKFGSRMVKANIMDSNQKIDSFFADQHHFISGDYVDEDKIQQERIRAIQAKRQPQPYLKFKNNPPRIEDILAGFHRQYQGRRGVRSEAGQGRRDHSGQLEPINPPQNLQEELKQEQFDSISEGSSEGYHSPKAQSNRSFKQLDSKALFQQAYGDINQAQNEQELQDIATKYLDDPDFATVKNEISSVAQQRYQALQRQQPAQQRPVPQKSEYQIKYDNLLQQINAVQSIQELDQMSEEYLKNPLPQEFANDVNEALNNKQTQLQQPVQQPIKEELKEEELKGADLQLPPIQTEILKKDSDTESEKSHGSQKTMIDPEEEKGDEGREILKLAKTELIPPPDVTAEQYVDIVSKFVYDNFELFKRIPEDPVKFGESFNYLGHYLSSDNHSIRDVVKQLYGEKKGVNMGEGKWKELWRQIYINKPDNKKTEISLEQFQQQARQILIDKKKKSLPVKETAPIKKAK